MFDRPKFRMPCAGTTSPLRAIHSLRETHVADLSSRIAGLPGTWSLERHESYDGDLTAMLLPQADHIPGFVVSHSAAGFHLGANSGNDYHKLGCFASIDTLVSMIMEAVAGWPHRAANTPAIAGG